MTHVDRPENSFNHNSRSRHDTRFLRGKLIARFTECAIFPRVRSTLDGSSPENFCYIRSQQIFSQMSTILVVNAVNVIFPWRRENKIKVATLSVYRECIYVNEKLLQTYFYPSASRRRNL